MKKKLLFAFLVLILLVGTYFLYSEYGSKYYILDFFAAANNENCQKLYPITTYSLQNHDVICPRGDVGNFMVIDKVEYKLQSILASKLSNTKQALVSVCIEARGQAAWNEGKYKGCTTDPRLIEFKRIPLGWRADMEQFTNISKLINESGSKPEGYNKFRDECIENHIQDVQAGGIGFDCNNVVRSDIEYAIKTHKFSRTGVAH